MPEGWAATTFGNLLASGDILGIQDGNHGELHPKASDYVEDGIPFVMARDLTGGTVNFAKCSFIRAEQAQKLRIGHAKPGDVLISHKGTVGEVAMVPNRFSKIMLTPQVTYYRVREGGRLDAGYLFSFLRSHPFQSRFRSLAAQSTRDYIGITEQKKLNIFVPPLPEQKKIAEVLSTWDKAIETTEMLLANAEAHKRTLMQKLLDRGSWPLSTIGQLGSIRSAGVDKKEAEGEKPVRLLNYIDVLRRDRIFSHELDHWVTAPDRQVENCDIKKGDVFFTPSSETRVDIGHSAVAMEDIPNAAYSYHVVRFRPTVQIDLAFSAYAFKSQHFYRQCQTFCEGSGQRYVISQDYFRSFSIALPPIDQQRDIGRILSRSDDVIANHRRDIGALNVQKQVLMQQLLTGKKRVTV